ncbi:MAG: PQQ-binding-like beta-propeller repeat protein [Candidatus Omnitrophica bacterium]|nr:PQQ-binding-like beta-propeller repeat protein [Candidatus Omnitrophota bacterium]
MVNLRSYLIKGICFLFWLLLVFFPDWVLADEWSQFSHDAQRTGYNPQNLNENWTYKWIWNGGGRDDPNHLFYSFQVQPVAGDGKIYIGTMNFGPINKQNKMVAINEITGQEVWVFSADSPILHTAAYSNGSVYFASKNGTFYKVNSGNGQLQQSRQLNGEVEGAPLLAGDYVYTGTNNGNFYALNKNDLSVRWTRFLGAAIKAPSAYSQKRNLIIVETEDINVYALNANDGSIIWQKNLGGYHRVGFARSYPVVSDINDVVLIRVDIEQTTYACSLMFNYCAGSTVEQIRNQLITHPELETMFVLNLLDGSKKYIAPVIYTAEEQNWNTGCFSRDMAPQAVVKRISDNEEVAYLFWRSWQVNPVPPDECDARGDSTYGEMNISNGNIRFVQVDEGIIRLASDEVGPLSMAGDFLFFNNWSALQVEKIVDRSSGKGNTFGNPITTKGIYSLVNTISNSDYCYQRADHYCPNSYFCAPPDCQPGCDSEYCWHKLGGGVGFFMYSHDRYTEFTWPTFLIPKELGFERNTQAVINTSIDGKIMVYYKYRDGTILAVQAGTSSPSSPSPLPSSVFYLKGDVDHSGKVNVEDIKKILLNYGKNPLVVINYWDPQSDNKVNLLDFGWVVKDWGK